MGAFSLAGASGAAAQQTSSTLTGTVVDNAGVLPGATVTATEKNTAVSRTVARRAA